MVKCSILEILDFFKGVHIVIITILEYYAFKCPKDRGVLSPFFATNEFFDDKLMVKDY